MQNEWLIDKIMELYLENDKKPLEMTALSETLHTFAEKVIFQKKLKHFKLGCDMVSQKMNVVIMLGGPSGSGKRYLL
jgi:2-phosphoglycerate kinase